MTMFVNLADQAEPWKLTGGKNRGWREKPSAIIIHEDARGVGNARENPCSRRRFHGEKRQRKCQSPAIATNTMARKQIFIPEMAPTETHHNNILRRDSKNPE